MTTQNKKNVENDYLKTFLSSQEVLQYLLPTNILKKEVSESPDFILHTNNERIGIELTELITPNDHTKIMLQIITIGNKVINYFKSKENLNISLIIGKTDMKRWSTDWQERFEYFYSPEFKSLPVPDEEMKDMIIKEIHNKLPELRKMIQTKISIQIKDEYWYFQVSLYPSIRNKYECSVNNTSIVKELSLDTIQNIINNKNNKYTTYKQKCNKCYLLIVYSREKGNSYNLPTDIKEHKFSSVFDGIFLLDYSIFGNKIYKLNNKS